MQTVLIAKFMSFCVQVDAVRSTKRYWEYLMAAARKRFDAGMPADQAVRDISLSEFQGWLDPERIVVNVHSLYREFRGEQSPLDPLDMSAKMLHFRNERRA